MTPPLKIVGRLITGGKLREGKLSWIHTIITLWTFWLNKIISIGSSRQQQAMLSYPAFALASDEPLMPLVSCGCETNSSVAGVLFFFFSSWEKHLNVSPTTRALLQYAIYLSLKMCSNGFEFVHEVRDVWKRVWCTLRTGILKRVEFGINVQRDRVWSGLRDAKQTEMKNPDPVWSISDNRKRIEQRQQQAPRGAWSSKSVLEKSHFLTERKQPHSLSPWRSHEREEFKTRSKTDDKKCIM